MYLFLDVCDGLMAKSPVGQVHETRQLPNSFKMIGIDGPMSIGQRSVMTQQIWNAQKT